jgi:hypothetical protein
MNKPRDTLARSKGRLAASSTRSPESQVRPQVRWDLAHMIPPHEEAKLSQANEYDMNGNDRLNTNTQLTESEAMIAD